MIVAPFISRRSFLSSVTAAGVAISPLGRIRAADSGLLSLRVATVLPSRTGAEIIRASVNDIIGDAARHGAVLADNLIGDAARAQGIGLHILFANSPSVEAAVRAGERLVETGDIHALIGGVGEGQAAALAAIAAKAGVPFFNVGEVADTLRETACDRHVFHVEASEAMYLDAMAVLSTRERRRRWFVLHDDSAAGAALADRALAAATSVGIELAGTASTVRGQPIYFSEIAAAVKAEADAIVLLLDDADQIAVLMQEEQAGTVLPALALPPAITQTRDYIAAARFRAPQANPRLRLALWETTLQDNGAGAFNDRYRGQFGEPTDPTAWSTYHAIKIVVDTVQATGSTAAGTIIAHLENPQTRLDLLKGPGVSFRPWDHQLRQPLYVVRVDQELAWNGMSLDSRIGIARFESELPERDVDADAVARLDRLGNGPGASACRL